MKAFTHTFLFIFFSCYFYAQQPPGCVARFSFSNSELKSEIGIEKARGVGISFTEDRFGNAGSAVYLQGNPDCFLTLGTDSVFKPIRGTISLWVKINQPLHKGIGVMHNPILFTRSREEENCNEAYFIGYHIELKNINVNTSNTPENQITLYPTKETSLLEWHHVAIAYDDKYLSFYLDGILENKAAKNFKSEFLGGDSVVVGHMNQVKNKRYLNGSVDDIEFYHRVLQPGEIQQLYNAPNPNKLTGIIKIGLIILAVIIGILIVVYFVRRRIKKILQVEKEKNELLNIWYEQENRVLSAQMDPHFIFNSLNTIQQFIITNDNDNAQLYLSKFSRLMRKILESNTKSGISLHEEIDILEKYLEIESLRFNNVFKYTISVDDKLNAPEIKIPHFLIQPLIENAIWHGLLPKEGDKILTVTFKGVTEKLLSCVITDNGIGRKNSALIKSDKLSDKQSMAINFIEQRLALLTKIEKVNCGINITDEADANNESTGTTVEIKIPILGK